MSRIQRLSRKYTKRRWGPPVQGLTAASLLPSIREWAVPSQTPEGVCPPTAPVFVGGREPKVSRPWSRQSPLHPHAARHPPGPRSTRFARSAPYVTGRLTAATHKPSHIHGSCETASNIGPQETHAPTTSRKGPSCPARWGRNGIKIYNSGQRLAPLPGSRIKVSFRVFHGFHFLKKI